MKPQNSSQEVQNFGSSKSIDFDSCQKFETSKTDVFDSAQKSKKISDISEARKSKGKKDFLGIEIYKVDRKMLKRAKKKGYCLCDAVKKDDGSNACPCDEFLDDNLCKCGVFKRI